MPTDTTENTEKLYPYPIEIVTADNGYLVRVGCQNFVCEKDLEGFLVDLNRYLSLDNTLSVEYNWEGDFIYRKLEPELAKCMGEEKRRSPVFDYIKTDSNFCLESCVYRVKNGTITLNYLENTATVTQNTVHTEGLPSL